MITNNANNLKSWKIVTETGEVIEYFRTKGAAVSFARENKQYHKELKIEKNYVELE